MPRVRFRKHQPAVIPTQRDVLEAQRASERAFGELYDFAPQLDSVTVDVTLPAAATVRAVHTLGRAPVRWTIEDLTRSGGTVPAVSREAWDATSITLYSSAAGTAKVRVS